MSKLAQKIAELPVVAHDPTQHNGPKNVCYPVYPSADLEDWEAVEAVRLTVDKELQRRPTWREVQAHVDQAHGVEHPLPLEKFKYHWRRRCYCWPPDLRLS